MGNDINERIAQITSMRSMVGSQFVRPNPAKVEQFCTDLKESVEAQEYLKTVRGFSDATIEKFRLGYDKKRNAISIPSYKHKELVNIKYRYINPEENNGTKYGGERGAEGWLFNEEALTIARAKGRVLIVEGEFDCIAATQAGIKNVISPGSGKNGYNIWVELLDTIPEVYIAYDNDEPGKEASRKLATKIGIDKCREVRYPDDIKDANEFFGKYTIDKFRELITDAVPFYNYDYVNLGTILDTMRKPDSSITSAYIPGVNIGEDWLIVLSGVSNVGKTSACMNIASSFAKQGFPAMVIPFERGIESVGKRFLQTHFDLSEADFASVPPADWEKIRRDCSSLPVYFSLPKREQIDDTIRRAKRIFDVRVVVIDHLDYMVRGAGNNKNDMTGETLQKLKELAMETKVIMLVVHHLKKIGETSSDPFAGKRTPTLEDLKGSSNLYQDPEAVVMLYPATDKSMITIDVQKNKGKMMKKDYRFNRETGKIYSDVSGPAPLKEDATKEEKLAHAEQYFFGNE